MRALGVAASWPRALYMFLEWTVVWECGFLWTFFTWMLCEGTLMWVFRASEFIGQCKALFVLANPFVQCNVINISANMLKIILCLFSALRIRSPFWLIPMETMNRKFQRLHLSIIASAALWPTK